MIPTVHPVTRKPVASGNGKLKLPGHQVWLEVELPKVDRKITDFRPYQSHSGMSAHSPNTSASQQTQHISRPQPSPPVDLRHQLEFTWQRSPDFEPPNEANRPITLPSEQHYKLLRYAQKKGQWIGIRETKKNWGDNNGVSYPEVEAMIADLVNCGVALYSQDSTQWRSHR